MGVVDVDPESKSYGRLSAEWTCRTRAMNCTTLAGTPAVPAFARIPRIRTWSGAIWSFPVCDLRASIFSTPSRIRRSPQIVKVIEPEDVDGANRLQPPAHRSLRPRRHLHQRSGIARWRRAGRHLCHGPRDVRCRGRWEMDRGPQYLAYDFAWHLGYDIVITSEWGTPNMFENGANPSCCWPASTATRLHVWDLRSGAIMQVLDLGAEQQLVLELRPAHDPTKAYGFVGVVISLKDLSTSIWLWHQDGRTGTEWKIRRRSSRSPPSRPIRNCFLRC